MATEQEVRQESIKKAKQIAVSTLVDLCGSHNEGVVRLNAALQLYQLAKVAEAEGDNVAALGGVE